MNTQNPTLAFSQASKFIFPRSLGKVLLLLALLFFPLRMAFCQAAFSVSQQQELTQNLPVAEGGGEAICDPVDLQYLTANLAHLCVIHSIAIKIPRIITANEVIKIDKPIEIDLAQGVPNYLTLSVNGAQAQPEAEGNPFSEAYLAYVPKESLQKFLLLSKEELPVLRYEVTINQPAMSYLNGYPEEVRKKVNFTLEVPFIIVDSASSHS